jgi:hypothetical protein
MIFESEYSDNILKYLDKSVIKDSIKDGTKDSIKNNTFFMKLNNSIKECYKYIDSEFDLKSIISKSEPYINNTSLLNDVEFISKKTINYISTKLKYLTVYTYKNNIIHYITKNKTGLELESASESVPDVIIHMFYIIRIMKKLFGRDNFAQLVIYYECDIPKKFPIKKGNKIGSDSINSSFIIGVDNINSAVTFVTPSKNGNIILYRKEEILKVLIHELIHSNLGDWNLIKSDFKKDDFNKLFCTNYKIEINEAYTESIATIIYLIYKSIINKKMDLNTLFKNELRYSNYICAQIFKYYGIKSIRDIMTQNNSFPNGCKSFFPQGSNLFAYYILKNILLRNHIEYGNCLDKGTIKYKIKNKYIAGNIIDIILKNIDEFDINVLQQYIKTKKTPYLRMCL